MTFTIPPFSEVQNQIAFAITIITAFIGILIWLRRKKSVELSYAVKVTEIIGEKSVDETPSSMTIGINGITIRKLVRYRYVFWNSGANPIVSNHVKTLIQIEFPTILDRRLLRMTLKENGADILPPTKTATGSVTMGVPFEYLDPLHGFIVDVFTDEIIPAPAPTATIIGTNATLNRGRLEGDEMPRWLRIVLVAMALAPVVLTMLMLLTQNQKLVNISFVIAMFIQLFTALIIFIIAILSKPLNLKSALPPQGLRSP